MILSFRHKGLKLLYENDDRSKLPSTMIDRIGSILSVLDTAQDLDCLDRPSLKLHALKGDLKGFHAVTVRANWRIVFRYDDSDMHDIDFVDYH